MITSQDLEDLKLLKEFQESGVMEELKELRREFKGRLKDTLRLFKDLYHLCDTIGNNLHSLEEVIEKEEKLKSEILKQTKSDR